MSCYPASRVLPAAYLGGSSTAATGVGADLPGSTPAVAVPLRLIVASGGLSGRDVAALLVLAVVVVAAYCGSCLIWPYARCLACIGRSKKNRGSTSKRWGRCPRCGGTGERLRSGTRIIRAWRGGRWPR
jgi:hypothetical protein